MASELHDQGLWDEFVAQSETIAAFFDADDSSKACARLRA